jgi:predicted alpha/beta superfamily hydrolase
VLNISSFTHLLDQSIYSEFLKREVKYEVFYPSNLNANKKYPVIWMNDGQDVPQLKLNDLLRNFYNQNNVEHIFIAIHTNHNRLKEYGTSYFPDYKNRGNRATEYKEFVVKELMPYIQKHFSGSTARTDNFICGFSLGGLSAIDIMWEHPDLFSKVGVFSGSFWWRDRSYEDGYADDADRIMHKKIKNGEFKEGLRFWLQCGTNDETADRNNNGIIDSIDDTLDLIKELKDKGYSLEDITYLEVNEGQHNFDTWSQVFPIFLEWIFKK